MRKQRTLSRLEPVICFWPQRRTPWERLGEADYPGPGSESFMLHLGAVVHGDAYMPFDRTQAIDKTVIYVWVSEDAKRAWSYKLDLLAHNVTYASPAQMVEHARILRTLARVLPWNGAYTSHAEMPFAPRLRATLRALGITRARCYQPGGDPYYVDIDQPVHLVEVAQPHSVFECICAEFDRRRAKALRGRPIEELATATEEA